MWRRVVEKNGMWKRLDWLATADFEDGRGHGCGQPVKS